MFTRTGSIPHGKAEVLVTFTEDGEPKNHLLRDAADLNQLYAAHAEVAETERASLEASLAARREKIDQQAFERAEAEILDAAAKASATSEV